MVSGKANSSSSGSDGRDGSSADSPADRATAARSGGRSGARQRKAKKPPRPLDQTALHDLALAYVARFATTGAKLEAYLLRKLRERGQPEDDGESVGIDIHALVSRMIELGYVDDDAYARMRSRDLAARGFGARRIEQALWAAGVDENTRADHAPGEAAKRRAAVRLAEKRRLGPFGTGAARPDPRQREKAVAAMLRAGHEFAHARFILDAASREEIAEWLAEAEGADRDDEGMNGSW
ncbi:MAG: regulatory protein RecX [Erythrobacter sp.]